MSLYTGKISIDMSLRMWSDSISLISLLDQNDINIQHLHVAGKPIYDDKNENSRIAKRHFISLENTKSNDDQGLSAWLMHIIEIIRRNPNVSEKISTGEVEALAWISIFGRQVVSMPCVAPSLILSCSQLGIKIMLENYTILDVDGPPSRLWLS